MKNFLSRYSVLAIALLSMLVMASCSDDDDNFKPGEEIPAGSTGAFFAKGNTTDFTLDQASSTITLQLGRTDSTAAVTVPVTVERNDTSAISIPASVQFEAGQGTADLVITTNDLTLDRTYTVTLAIDSTETNVYANGGAPTITFTVMHGDPWKKVLSGVYFYMSDDTGDTPLYPRFTSDVYEYKNENRFYIENIMGSGRDLEFSFTSGFNADDPLSSDGYISWTNPGYTDTENSWDYITDVNGNYNWSVAGSSKGISTLGFYIGYNYLTFPNKYFSLYAYILCDDSSEESNYMYGVW